MTFLSNTMVEAASNTVAFAQTEVGRLIATGVIIATSILLIKFFQRRARSSTDSPLDIAHSRNTFVLYKNFTVLLAVILVVSVWASKVMGGAVSLAALAGASLLVGKEFVANLLGTVMYALSRPYRVGDYIQLRDIHGKVLDTHLLGTTVAETLEGHQLTGRTVELPHCLLLSLPVKNLTATGAYMINLLKVAVSPAENLCELEVALLKAAHEVCDSWKSDAELHLKNKESRDLIDLPSAEPRVLIEMHSSREYVLALRYTCRPNDRVKVEQEILRKYLAYRKPVISVPTYSDTDTPRPPND